MSSFNILNAFEVCWCLHLSSEIWKQKSKIRMKKKKKKKSVRKTLKIFMSRQLPRHSCRPVWGRLAWYRATVHFGKDRKDMSDPVREVFFFNSNPFFISQPNHTFHKPLLGVCSCCWNPFLSFTCPHQTLVYILPQWSPPAYRSIFFSVRPDSKKFHKRVVFFSPTKKNPLLLIFCQPHGIELFIKTSSCAAWEPERFSFLGIPFFLACFWCFC